MTQERAAASDALRRPRFVRVPTVGWALRVDNRAVPGAPIILIRAIPVSTPLPDVPGHVEEAVIVRGVTLHRGRAGVAVEFGVLVRKVALPDVREFAFRWRVVAPRVALLFQPAARCEFPLSLGRKSLP